MADVEINVEAEPEPEIVEEPVPELAAAAVAVTIAEGAVELSEQTQAAAELEAAALNVLADQERETWRTQTLEMISSQLTEQESRMLTALEALALRLETLSIPQAPLIVETPSGEEVIIPAEAVEQSQASGEVVSQEAQIRPKRHRWI